MILKASERANGQNLAAHLMNSQDNEDVEIHEISGFCERDLHAAFAEIECSAKGTRCKNYLFSLSLSPPADAKADTALYKQTLQKIEAQLNLTGQPRAIVFHEKDGRRHAHAVWSRIDTKTMKAIPMSHYKNKLNTIAKEVYLEQGWELPEGFIDREKSNPLNFTLAQWQQAKRLDTDPRILKTQLQECWARSTNKAQFETLLKRKGFYLAQGDRRGFVAVDWRGEVYSLSRWLDTKKKELQKRLGEAQTLPTVAQTQEKISQTFQTHWQNFTQTLRETHRQKLAPLKVEKDNLVRQQQSERAALQEAQKTTLKTMNAAHQKQVKRGLRGLWARFTGAHNRQQERHALALYELRQAQQQARDDLIFAQLQARQALQSRLQSLRKTQQAELYELQTDMKRSLAPSKTINPTFNL